MCIYELAFTRNVANNQKCVIIFTFFLLSQFALNFCFLSDIIFIFFCCCFLFSFFFWQQHATTIRYRNLLHTGDLHDTVCCRYVCIFVSQSVGEWACRLPLTTCNIFVCILSPVQLSFVKRKKSSQT